MVYNGNSTTGHENGSRNRVFVECKCYASSGEVEKTVKQALF